MADVTTTFAAKDESFARTVDRLQNRLTGFQRGVAGFTSSATGIARSFSSFVGPLAAMGAAFLGAQSAINTFREAIDVGGKLSELSQRTGETAGNLAVLQRAFQNAGSSGEAVGPMLNRLQRFMVEAANGGKTQAEALQKLGLSYQSLMSLSPTDQMRALANSIAAVSDPAQRSAAAMAVFGRSGGEMLPLLLNMSNELDSARMQLGSYPEAVDRAARALDSIGDNFAVVKKKAMEFVTGALVEIAPALDRALQRLADVDFAAVGMKLSKHLANAYDFFVGLFRDPSKIFGLYAAYLDATFRTAGDQLASSLVTAASTFINIFKKTTADTGRNVFDKLGGVLANTFIYAAAKLGAKLLDVFSDALSFYGTLWGIVTGQGTGEFSKKLGNVVRNFASDFHFAMTNPVAFIANKVASALIGATSEAAQKYQFAFDLSTGNIIEKAKSGMNAVAANAKTDLIKAADSFGESLNNAALQGVKNTEKIQLNLFNGAEAMRQVEERVANIQAAGAATRMDLEAAVPPAKEIAGAFTEAASAMQGFSAKLEEAVNKNKTMLDEMRESFAYGRESAEQTYDRLVAGGMDAAEASREASDYQSRQMKNDSDLRKAENKADRIERDRERALKRAQDMEARGQDAAALNLRRRTEKEYRDDMEKLNRDTKAAHEESKRLLEEGGDNAGDDMEEGGKAVREGGEEAGKELKDAADALKDAHTPATGTNLDNVLNFLRDVWFKDFQKRLPQNAMS